LTDNKQARELHEAFRQLAAGFKTADIVIAALNLLAEVAVDTGLEVAPVQAAIKELMEHRRDRLTEIGGVR
jgi:hypothetical protein